VAEDETHDSREARLAENEATARRENESRSDWFHGHKRVTFVCECADPDCSETLSFDREMYEALRESPSRFAVAVNHDVSSIERVVKRHRHCWVVEKTGEAATVAKESVETTDVRKRRGEAPEVVKETVEREVVVKTDEAADAEDASLP
jgi:hypothetical protein